MPLRSCELALVLALAPGCSLVFPLADGDAPPPLDVSPDIAPPSVCPAPGESPTFASPILHIIEARRCAQFTTSALAGLGVGPCDATGGVGSELFEGPLDGPLHPATITTQHSTLHSAVITPEGTQLVTLESDGDEVFLVETYSRVDDAWIHLAETQPAIDAAGLLGAPSAGPAARIAFFDAAGRVVELARAAGNVWEQARSDDSPFGALQPTTISGLHLTPNALGVMFTADDPAEVGVRVLRYADRMTTNEPFGLTRAIELSAESVFNDASLTNDCGRIYLTDFTGLGYVTPQ